MSDPQYRTFDYRFQNNGVVARDVYDKMRPGSYRSLQNLECRQENLLSTRYGLAALSTDGTSNFPLASPAQSLGRMKGLSNPYNYAAGGTILYRKATDGIGAYASIATGLSGGRVSMYPYRPNGSSQPWMFIADNGKLLKDNGSTGSAENWGISPPTQPCLVLPQAPSLIDIELFDEGSTTSFTLSSFGSAVMNGRVQGIKISAVTSPGLQSVSIGQISLGASNFTRSGGVTTVTAVAHGFSSNMRIQVAMSAPADASFQVTSAIITFIDVNHFSYPNPGANQTGTGGGGAIINPGPSLMAGMTVTTTDVNAESVLITEVITQETTVGNPTTNLTVIVGNFTQTHAAATALSSLYLAGTVAANTTATISKQQALSLSFPSVVQVAADQNYIQLYVLVANPLAVRQITLLMDVGDGTFTQDYYSKSITMSPAQTAASGTQTAAYAQSGAVFQRAAGAVDFSTPGGANPSLLPADYPLLSQLQTQNLSPGTNPWTQIIIPLSDFVPNGAAGGPTSNWGNVVGWQIQIQTQPNIGTSFGFDDLIFVGGSDLNSNGGNPYDYRSTFYNLATGDESSPSVEMVGNNPIQYAIFPATGASPVPLSVVQQAIQVTPQQPSDPQVTHINIYRRGGTLTQAWYFVSRIPVGQLTFVDTVADSTIEVNDLLNINADAPVTSLLATPVNYSTFISPGSLPGVITLAYPPTGVVPGQLMTLGSGNTLEQAYVITANNVSLQFTIYSQLNYNITGSPVLVQVQSSTRPNTPMNLMAIAFDKAWLAGDPNNPHVLYYSTTFQPETFPVQNSLEVGTPDAPIMALVEMNGLLFVFTTKRVYEILGAGSAVPTVIPTAVKHGLSAQFAWCAAENVIYYLSYDGIYAFSGGASGYISEPVEWIWTGKNLGPVPAIGSGQMANVFMAYANHEVFVTYRGQNGQTDRLIFHDVYRRWRNDLYATGAGENITAQYFAEDVGILFVAKSDGMVYQDRVNDYDSAGFVGGVETKVAIPFLLETAQMDQSEADPTLAKRKKLYNELTIDADLNGQSVTVLLNFDSGATTTFIATLTGVPGAGRQQFQLNINNGDGYESLNVGLVLIGATVAAMNFFECHIRAAPQAEARQSWDTWWLGYGTDEWHLYKQIFAEYRAPTAAVSVLAFTDGNMTAPAFNFILPQTTGPHRASKKIRFPSTKCRLIRFIGICPADFFMYDDTQIEHKKLGSAKGYERGKISP